MNSLDGRIKANAAIVPAGANGSVSVFASDTANVVLDIDGYFAPAGDSTLAFYPLTPCRLVDTRNARRRSGRAILGRQPEARISRCRRVPVFPRVSRRRHIR